jgi:hypothetical protein
MSDLLSRYTVREVVLVRIPTKVSLIHRADLDQREEGIEDVHEYGSRRVDSQNSSILTYATLPSEMVLLISRPEKWYDSLCPSHMPYPA